MSEKQSIWSKADSFLTTTRKIIFNSLTALILVIVTFSFLGGIGSMFSSSEEIDTENKVTIKMISKRSLIKGFMPNTLRDADKKYINSMKLKP